jgi:glycosyltransferase involved in cell wall biosynthesis
MSVLYSRLNPDEHRLERPVPIAFGITDLDVGGAEKALVELVTRLDPRKWSRSVVCLQPAGPLAEPLRNAGVPVTSLDVKSWRDLPSATTRWKRELRLRLPAILQTFLFHANLLGRLVGKAARVPIIVSGVRVAERRAKGHLLFDRLTHRLSDAHACVSRATADFQQEAACIPRSRIAVIPNGVAGGVPYSGLRVPKTDRTRPPSVSEATLLAAASGTRDWGLTTPTLVVVGRLDRQKGVDLLLDSLAYFRQSKRPFVTIVGTGSEREALERKARQLNLMDRVRFVGWQPNPKDWIAAADALVLPSRWEGMPNVVLEAMAAGKPVIATDVEGVADLIEDGVHGFLAPSNDATGLGWAIYRFLTARPQWSAMGEAARARALGEFSFDAMVQRYERLWLDLIERRRERFRPISHEVKPDYCR